MSETNRERIEQVILSNLAEICQGHENIPYVDRLAAVVLSAEIAEKGRNPWAIRADGGDVHLGGSEYRYDVTELLSKKTCKEIEDHPEITLGGETDA